MWKLPLVAMACLSAAGCVVAPAGEDDESPAVSVEQETLEAPDSGRSLPDVKVDGDLVYQVLVGEIAAKQGDLDTAAEALMEAAARSRDPRLAQRATRIAQDAERFEVALEAASLWAELEPDRTLPMESIALIMTEQGRIDEADEQFGKLLAAAGEAVDGEMRRIARLLGQLSNQENASTVMDRIVGRYEDNADAHFAAAFLADRSGRDEAVLASLDRALALRPDWEDAALAKLGHLIQNQYPKEKVDGFAAEFLETAPAATRVRISYARYLVDQEATREALQQFRAVLEYAPKSTAGLMAAGLLSVQEENYKDARRYFKRHLELTPDNDQVRLYLGQVAEERERYGEAERWYREITDQDQLFTARLHLASVINKREGLEAALEHLKNVRTDTEDEFVRLALTREMLLREADELTRAKAVLDDAVARYPDNTDLLYSRGLLAARLDQLGEHEQDMRALLAENPNNAHALNALGYTLADATDRIQEAHDLISKALSMRPDDPFILDSMGWVQYRLGNLQDAIQYLERALSMREDAEIAAHLGEVLWVKGDRDRARDIWKRARQEHPDNHVLNETIERFAQ